MQSAIGATQSGATIYICPGTYGRGNPDTPVARLSSPRTLVGAGSGPGGTILTGGGVATSDPVVNVSSTAELRDLTVTGGNSTEDGGGIATSGGLTLTRVRVTGNTTTQRGGGIASSATITLNATTVTGNTAAEGGGIHTTGTLILNDGSSITPNIPDDCDGGGCP